MTNLSILFSESKDLAKELTHIEIVNIFIDEFNNWDNASKKVTENINKAFNIVFATCR